MNIKLRITHVFVQVTKHINSKLVGIIDNLDHLNIGEES